jgi:hypothetical protein
MTEATHNDLKLFGEERCSKLGSEQRIFDSRNRRFRSYYCSREFDDKMRVSRVLRRFIAAYPRVLRRFIAAYLSS